MDLLEETKNREIEYDTVMSVFVTWTANSKYEVLQNKLPATTFTIIFIPNLCISKNNGNTTKTRTT